MSRPVIIHTRTSLRLFHNFERSLKELGITVKRRGYEYMDTPDEIHLIWSLTYRIGQYEALRSLPNVWQLENGWFQRQKYGFQLDPQGLHADSHLCGKALRWPVNYPAVEQMRAWYGDHPSGTEYVLFIGQMANDAQIRDFSRFGLMRPLVEALADGIGSDLIVIRPHPRDRKTNYNDIPGTTVNRAGSFGSLVSKASAVIGVNSTALIEALFFFKPVVALGKGVFSGNQAMVEWSDCRLPNLVDATRRPTPTLARDRFLSMLLDMIVPYKITPRECETHPLVSQVVAQALR